MYGRLLSFDTGPSTLVPLVHIPLLRQAPRHEGAYMVIPDSMGDLCHFYGDFSGFHIYMITSSLKKQIVQDSIDYYDRENGLFSVSLTCMLDNGLSEVIRVEDCEAPLHTLSAGRRIFPENITVARFSPGTPDALRFHFPATTPKIKFSHNIVPSVPENSRLAEDGLFNLRIEYIGKAFGRDGSREIADRLGVGHSTESQIANEFVHKHTNRDLQAILFRPGRLKDASGSDDPLFSFQDVVSVLEQSLISSFLPTKNRQSRQFPNDGSMHAQKLLKNGISRLLITVNSPLDYGLLWTDEASPARKHRFQLDISPR